jgi:hypothetical protein
VGTFLGGGMELAVRGTTEATPSRGLGYGAAGGVLLSGFLATQLRVAPSRVLTADLGAGLGALAGAAAASPLLLDDPSENEQRAWVLVTLGGTLAGAAAAVYLTRGSSPSRVPSAAVILPRPTILAATPVRGEARAVPALVWAGSF